MKPETITLAKNYLQIQQQLEATSQKLADLEIEISSAKRVLDAVIDLDDREIALNLEDGRILFCSWHLKVPTYRAIELHSAPALEATKTA
jgi:chaperonin cofactor prefoldin